MPYNVKKSGSGYKVFKKGTKKSFSKKPLAKKKAEAQMKALYASEQQNENLQEEVQEMSGTLVFKNLYKYPKANEFHVHYSLEGNENVLISLVYSAGETMEEVDYIETRVTDSSIPNIEVFEDPISEEAKAILDRYSLTGDDIENAGQEGYERISKHYPEEDVKESLEFEKLYQLITGNEP
jgi:hypothetical protein